MTGSVFLRESTPTEPSSRERIVDAAIRSFSQHGVSHTPLRTVADAAGVSVGLVQHYFGNKAGLTAAVDEYVLRVFGEVLESEPLPEPPADHSVELRGRFARLFHKYPEVTDYVAHALCQGDEIGNVIFDGLLRISTEQGDKYIEHGLVRSDLDLLWGVINPLILRVGATMLRHHIERHIPEPFYTPAQLQRWDSAVTALIRKGQFKPEATDT
ncbi:TetR/AcrR family transcriptional regulator [Mycolicibacterium sp. P9-22]|uniref:TetR/AcrR family transcriptional regulator n=1 Tax=Mycolicibacterium sp. P9-22 TaxID=2024613 RepID=UPI001D140FC5|nr:TetR/AcrR family transcriptional regulator [Mycolicibacterium sp. P9-22]